MNFEDSNLGLINLITDQLIDIILHERIFQNTGIDHRRLDEIIWHILYAAPCQVLTPKEEDCFPPVTAEYICNFVHCGRDQLVDIFVWHGEALNELIVQCVLILELFRARLRNAECIPVIEALLDVIVAILVTVPQFDHGGGED